MDEDGVFSICMDFALITDSGTSDAPPDPIRARYMDAVEEKSRRAAYARHGRHYSIDSVRSDILILISPSVRRLLQDGSILDTSRSVTSARSAKDETVRRTRSASRKRTVPAKPILSVFPLSNCLIGQPFSLSLWFRKSLKTFSRN